MCTEIDAHIIGFAGTRLFFCRSWDGLAHKSSVAQHWRYFEGRWRYEQTRFSNMLAGVSILVNKRSWEPRHVVRTSGAPLKLQGRAGAGRLQNWQEDINTIVMYCLPTPQDPGSRAPHAETLYCLAGWLRKTFQHALHHDGPQQSGGRPQEMRRKIGPWHETSYQKEIACQPPLQGPHAGRRDGSDQHISGGRGHHREHKRNLDSHRLHCSPRGNVGAVELVSSLDKNQNKAAVQLRRSTRRHDHFPVSAVFLKETEQKKKRENSQCGL